MEGIERYRQPALGKEPGARVVRERTSKTLGAIVLALSVSGEASADCGHSFSAKPQLTQQQGISEKSREDFRRSFVYKDRQGWYADCAAAGDVVHWKPRSLTQMNNPEGFRETPPPAEPGGQDKPAGSSAGNDAQERKNRQEERTLLEKWSRQFESMEDEKLLQEIADLLQSLESDQRAVGESFRKDSQTPENEAIRWNAIYEKKLQLAKDAWSERKGYQKKNRKDLLNLMGHAEDDVLDATGNILKIIPGKTHPREVQRLERELRVQEARLRLLDEETAGVAKGKPSELLKKIASLKLEENQERRERWLKIAREAYAERSGITRLPTAKLLERKETQEKEKSALDKEAYAVKQRIDALRLPSTERARRYEEELDPIQEKLLPVEEDLNAMQKILAHRKKRD